MHSVRAKKEVDFISKNSPRFYRSKTRGEILLSGRAGRTQKFGPNPILYQQKQLSVDHTEHQRDRNYQDPLGVGRTETELYDDINSNMEHQSLQRGVPDDLEGLEEIVHWLPFS